MSYARWSTTSDVYIYDTDDGTTCCACRLNDGHTLITDTHDGMVEHVEQHIAAGHQVPDDLIDALQEEIP